MAEAKKRTTNIHFIVILLIGIMTCWYTFEEKVELLGDNADYYTLSKAIAQGEGYVLLSHPDKIRNNHYPPGYSALLSPVLLITDYSVLAAKLFNCLLFLGSLVLIYLISARFINQVVALVIAVFIALNSHILFYASIMMSEVPYLFFSLLTLWAFINLKDSFSWKDKYLYISLIALVITYYIRALGLAMLIGIVIHLLINKEWKKIAFFIIGWAICAAPWMVRSSELGGSSYIYQLKQINPYQPSLGEAGMSDFIARIGENFQRYITKEIPAAFYPAVEANYQQPATGGDWFFGLLLVGFGLVGFWFIKSYRFLLLAYLLATFGILMLWPQVWIGVRFIVPIIPFFYLGLASFFSYYYYSKLNQSLDYKPYLLLILAFPLLSPIKVLHDDADAPYHPAWNSYFTAAEWVRTNLEEDAVVATGKPSLFYLYSNRPVVRFPFSEDGAQLIEGLEQMNVDYVVIDQVYGNTLRYLLPAVQQNRDRFEVVHQVQDPETFVLRFRK